MDECKPLPLTRMASAAPRGSDRIVSAPAALASFTLLAVAAQVEFESKF